MKALCKHPEINAAVLENLKECAKIGKLTRVDTPIAVYLETEPWLPETGLVTDALKLKRKVCKKKNHTKNLLFYRYSTITMLLLSKTCTENKDKIYKCTV